MVQNQKMVLQQTPQTTNEFVRVRALLWLIDGSYEEMQLFIPFLGRGGEIYEKGMVFLRGYVQNLTQHWIGLRAFQIVQEVKNKETSQWELFMSNAITEIPAGKVFVGKMDFGKWIDPSGLSRAEEIEIKRNGYPD